ncbi:hypothetical protein ACFWNQ_29025 [Streptomyces virginiae]|uniref:hypothetical protein n=1 Tax=Streptomyces virginiae TaxID=1961 RepID=UPI0036657F25
MNRQLYLCLAGLCLLALGCEAGRTQVAVPTGKLPPASTAASAASPSETDLVLAGQIQITAKGADAGPRPTVSTAPNLDCRAGLARWHARGSYSPEQPLVWLTRTDATDFGVSLLGDVALCLYKFPASGALTVSVQTGNLTYTTPLIGGIREQSSALAPDTLFNDRALIVEDVGGEVLQSGTWEFLPAGPAREAVGLAGWLTLTASASADAVTATDQVPVLLQPNASLREGWTRTRELLVYGYPAEANVPIGLYQVGADELANLVGEIGTVVMPPSRIATFAIPQKVLGLMTEDTDTATPHCLGVPMVRGCFH